MIVVYQVINQVFTEYSFQEILQEVEKWMNKYDTDIESIDLKIQLKKNEYNNQTATRKEMEELVRSSSRTLWT